MRGLARCHIYVTFVHNQGGMDVSANSPKGLIGLFSKRFEAGDIDALLELYQEDAVFPNHHTIARGTDHIRAVLQGVYRFWS
jgi:ketosteroid isomerase-like protein